MAAPATGGIAQSTLDVSLNAPPLSGGGGQASVTRYTTQRGETLQTIARAVYGDARLWYRLADAMVWPWGLTRCCWRGNPSRCPIWH